MCRKNKISQIFLTTILVLLITSSLLALEDEFTFKTLDVNDGLANNTVHYIHQDSKGFMWFATEAGLCKYDGYEFTIFDKNSEWGPSLSDNFTETILEDKPGELWIGTNNGGLIHFNTSTYELTTYTHNKNDPTSISDNRIVSLFLDSRQNIWTGNYFDGLNRFNRKTKSFENFKNENDIDATTINCIKEDTNGIIWFATNEGLYSYNYDTDEFDYLLIPDLHGKDEKSRQVFTISIDANNLIWAGTQSGIYLVNPESKKISRINFTSNYQIPDSTVEEILFTDDLAWIGTSSALFVYDIERKKTISVPKLLRELVIESIFQDRNGTIWIGTHGSGIFYYHNTKKEFRHYNYEESDANGLSSSIFRAIYEDIDGKLWLATDNSGIDILDRETNTVTYLKANSGRNSLSGDDPNSILRDTKGTMWIGYWMDGISKIPAGSNTIIHQKNPLKIIDKSLIPDNNVQCIIEDKFGNVWFGTGEGIAIYNHKLNEYKFIKHNPNDVENSLTSRSIQSNSIKYDIYGNFWVGSYKGLNMLTPSKPNDNPFYTEYTIKNFNGENKNQLSDSRVISIWYDSIYYPNTIFVGTYGGGINIVRMDSTKNNNISISQFTSKQGLPNDIIYAILSDNSGNLWISTNDGLCKFNPATGNIKIYSAEDGTNINQYNWGAAYKSKSGELFFGSITGFISFYPERIKDDESKPQIAFTNLQLFNKPVQVNQEINNKVILNKTIAYTKELNLSYKENIISLAFAAMHFAYPDKNQYKYILEGFDEEWTRVESDKRYVTYTNLDPGTYIFKVKASNYDGYWNNNPLVLTINISPPFWETWIFRISVLLLIALGVVFIFRVRMKQIKKRAKELEHQVNERTKELNEANVVLRSQTTALNETNTLLEERQQRVEEQAEELRVQAEVLTDTNDQLEATNASKDKFFSIIAHDLKNPLSSILGLSEMFSVRFEKIDTEKKLKYASEIYASAKKTYELLVNLLEWSRSQTNRIKVEPSVISLNSIIEQNVQLLQQNINDKQINIDNALDNNLVAYADFNMCNTVFRNLLSNAIKFTPKGGKISISSSNNNNTVAVTISDSGIGIPNEKLKNIFKIDKNTTTKGTEGESGTGLGLILCKEFISHNNGNIEIKSEVGKGTSICITLVKTHINQNK
jgi:ligand-binding sensor domain-containing protein/anti-sigma regulatory factor (Ser/Thr protein kinase)